MIRMLTMAGGVAGATAFSQYPEFSQQYTQRLAGQLDALTQVVADFEASALKSGLTRTQAFEQMTGTPFLEDRQADMRRTFTRHAALSDDLMQLREASALERLAMPHRIADTETIARTWDDFEPAVPLNLPGVMAAILGYVGGWAVVAALISAIGWPLRRLFGRRQSAQTT